MNALRRNLLAKVFALLTGAIFLNTSFFMVELSLLKVSNQNVLQNIIKLAYNVGLEEEQDGDSVKDSTANEMDLLFCPAEIYQQSVFTLISKVSDTRKNHYPPANYSQTFSPPPDLTHLS